MFSIEINKEIHDADLMPGYLIGAAERPASNFIILDRVFSGEKAVYEVISAGYAKKPDGDIFVKEDIDVRVNDTHYVMLIPGARKAKLIKELTKGLRLESHMNIRDNKSVLAPVSTPTS